MDVHFYDIVHYISLQCNLFHVISGRTKHVVARHYWAV